MNEFDLIYRTFLAQGTGYARANELAFIDKSIGDDCAIITPPNGQKLVICTDTLVQGRHFADDWESVERLAFEIGYKSVAVNLSDLSAMGAIPHSILLAIALPQRLANSGWLDTFAKGLFFACDNNNVALIGGDTTKSDKLVITVTAQGFANQGLYRHTAQVDDDIYVSGTVGDAGFALKNLNNELGKSLAHRLNMPTPRVSLGQALNGAASAMIDISDGLYQDLGHIAEQSGVGFRLDLDKLPTSEPLSQVGVAERLQYQLTGGDDYELLFTLPKDSNFTFDKTNITKIGTITESKDKVLRYQGTQITVENPYPFVSFPDLKGFSHFE